MDYSVDGCCVPLVGTALGPFLGLAENSLAEGLLVALGLCLAAGRTGFPWEGNLLCL